MSKIRPAVVPILLTLAWLSLSCASPEPARPLAERPNILLIVADDLGYSDLGAYGSEIPTPHIDELTDTGLLATDFYVAPRGAPTRAMLLTGVDNLTAGISERPLRPASGENASDDARISLSPRTPTVASRLRKAGYFTAMAGKWELGTEPHNLPASRGFERSFALHDGAASHWADMKSARPGRDRALITSGGKVVDELPADYFATQHATDFIMQSIREAKQKGQPFFAYLAPQSPHGPLAAPEALRDIFEGRYDEGFDSIRGARLMRQKKLGLVRQDVVAYPGIPTVPSWANLSDDEKKRQARKMELYAAMVAHLDDQVGRLMELLRELDLAEDTLVVLLSDNGPEPANRGPDGMDPRHADWYAQQFPSHGIDAWGKPGSFVEYGAGWAEVSSVPFRLFKGTMAEGGIRVPLIVSGWGVEKPLRTAGPWNSDALLHVMDLAPTFLDMAGVEQPSGDPDEEATPVKGHSLRKLLAGDFGARKGPHEWLAFSYAGDSAIRYEEWKMVWMPPPFGSGSWRLYRIGRDPAELYNRFEDREDERDELLALWQRYSSESGAPQPPAPKAETAAAGVPATN